MPDASTSRDWAAAYYTYYILEVTNFTSQRARFFPCFEVELIRPRAHSVSRSLISILGGH